jgi:hypothetical protein
MSDKQQVLEMLATGKISADEAARLLESLEDAHSRSAAAESERRQHDAVRMQGKKLRVEVNGFVEVNKKINVNVSIPLILARHVDNLLANCMPDEAHTELIKQGIDLRKLNISQIVDTFEDLEEDIVNADIDHDDACLKVRVYVE